MRPLQPHGGGLFTWGLGAAGISPSSTVGPGPGPPGRWWRTPARPPSPLTLGNLRCDVLGDLAKGTQPVRGLLGLPRSLGVGPP